jgi:diguanylate cyclase (GGDEF)-like protein
MGIEKREQALSAKKKDGSEFAMESALFALNTEAGLIAVNLMRDISVQRKEQDIIEKYAFIDSLTNLPNRRYFEDNLKRTASKAARDNTISGILYLDLDKFKPINDTYGHAIGDLVLCEIGVRLSKLLRQEDLLARVGGDEFVLTIFPVSQSNYLENIAERILATCSAPIYIEDHVLNVSASIGISFNKTAKFDEQALVQSADKAMYQAKKNGRNCFILVEVS